MKIHLLTSFLIFPIVIAYSQELDGDWMYVSRRGETYSNHVGFRFRADSLWELGNGGTMNYGKYRKEKDTLSFSNSENEVISYKIKLTKDSLTLKSPSGTVSKYYSRNLEYDGNLTFKKIIFEMESNDEDARATFTLDKNGKARFEEERNNKITRKRFKIDKERIDKIDSAFKWSFIEHLDTTNYYASSSEQLCKITVVYNGDKTATINGMRFNLPLRLRGFMWYIFNEMRKKGLA